jgi:hypothetical protein
MAAIPVNMPNFRVECEIGPDGAAQPEQRLLIAIDTDLKIAYGRCTKPADPEHWHIKMYWAVKKEFDDGAAKVLVSYSDSLQPGGNKVTFYVYREQNLLASPTVPVNQA